MNARELLQRIDWVRLAIGGAVLLDLATAGFALYTYLRDSTESFEPGRAGGIQIRAEVAESLRVPEAMSQEEIDLAVSRTQRSFQGWNPFRIPTLASPVSAEGARDILPEIDVSRYAVKAVLFLGNDRIAMIRFGEDEPLRSVRAGEAFPFDTSVKVAEITSKGVLLVQEGRRPTWLWVPGRARVESAEPWFGRDVGVETRDFKIRFVEH